MKKILLLFIFFNCLLVNAVTLKGGVSEDVIPKGFFGSWGVISKLQNTNNPSVFNYESRDIWTLSGYNDVLILDNLESGAHSKIIVKEQNRDGKTLKFNRQKTIQEKGQKIVYKETVSFVLAGKFFTGTDVFVVERYDKNGGLIKIDSAKYQVSGTKISGDNP